MILKASLFNKGIFSNTLKRFKWGSILYFVILFFAVPFPLLVSDINDLVVSRTYSSNIPLLIDDFAIGFPIFLAVVVPTIVAVLVQNNVHSGKQGIFMHGLPVSRGSTYISQLLASFVLMAAPVAANALILFIMSLSPYGKVISSSSVAYWLALNLAMQFIMFSVAVFSGYLTGNAAAHIGINVFLHLASALVALVIFLVSDIFLFGFSQADSFIANQLIDYNPIVWLTNHMMDGVSTLFAAIPFWMYFIMALGFYVLGFILYKKRKIEACGDVAAFKAFRPILKYSVVTAAVSAIFGIFVSADIPAIAIFFIAIIVGAVCYFAAEMLLSKTVKVFGRYRGYLGFMAATAAFISFFAFTSVCGYETRIPDKEDIAKASIHQGYSMIEPYLDDSDFIDDCIQIHKEFISDIPVTEKEEIVGRYLMVSYELKNGRTMNRRYLVQSDVANKVLSKMYEYEEYKILVTELDELNIENVTHLTIDLNARSISDTYTLTDGDAVEFLKAIEKDVRELSYNEMHIDIPAISLSVYVGISKEENDRLHYFKDEIYGENAHENSYQSFDINVSANFKNAFEFLKKKGYYANIINKVSQNLAILKEPVTKETSEPEFYNEMYSYKTDYGSYHEFNVSTKDMAYIKPEDAKVVAELIVSTPADEKNTGKYYYLYNYPQSEKTILSLSSRIASFDANKLPEVLKKYI